MGISAGISAGISGSAKELVDVLGRLKARSQLGRRPSSQLKFLPLQALERSERILDSSPGQEIASRSRFGLALIESFKNDNEFWSLVEQRMKRDVPPDLDLHAAQGEAASDSDPLNLSDLTSLEVFLKSLAREVGERLGESDQELSAALEYGILFLCRVVEWAKIRELKSDWVLFRKGWVLLWPALNELHLLSGEAKLRPLIQRIISRSF